jgi:PleD family two-component response regulator
MRVLLIESESEDVLFLRDVLMEIGEGRHGGNWMHIEVLDAGSWTQASALLSREAIDIVLLDIGLRDGKGVETFRRARLASPATAIILLVGGYEESLGVQLVREGAQDFLVKRQVDCAPLAHAMRNAIERQRMLNALHAASTHDTLTGLFNRAGFLASADRDRKLAERLGCRLMVMVAEIPSGYAEQRRDLALIETADHLRSLAGPADLLARIEYTRFGMTIFDTGVESVEQAWSRIHKPLLKQGIKVGAVVFSIGHPATLDALLDQAIADLNPAALAMGT